MPWRRQVDLVHAFVLLACIVPIVSGYVRNGHVDAPMAIPLVTVSVIIAIQRGYVI